MSIDDDETLFALNLALHKHDQEEYLKPETVDIDITTTSGQAKVVILQGFIVEVVVSLFYFGFMFNLLQIIKVKILSE